MSPVAVSPFVVLLKAAIAAVTGSIRRVDNGIGPITFRQWYFDEINDRLLPEDSVSRGYNYRLEATDDMDDLGTEELYYTPRSEQPPHII